MCVEKQNLETNPYFLLLLFILFTMPLKVLIYTGKNIQYLFRRIKLFHSTILSNLTM